MGLVTVQINGEPYAIAEFTTNREMHHMTQCHDYGHYHQIVDRSAHDEWEQSNPGTPLAADPHAGALAGTDAPPAGGDTGDQGEGE